MVSNKTVLMYGHNDALQHSRQMILEKAGFVVRLARNHEDFVSRCGDAGSPSDLILICYTVPEEQEQIIRGLADRLCLPIYFVLPFTFPADLIRNVSQLLA
jgi:hypothetical protein